MNIAVIAANGRLGRAFVNEALAAGHIVRAGVRGENHFEPHANLTIVSCDATDVDGLKALIDGQDAVVSTIGHVKGSKADVQTIATKAIIEAMNLAVQRRFVTVTGTGVRFPGDKVTLLDRFLNLGIGIIDPARIKDGQSHTKILQSSTLAWTLIRVLKLQNTRSKPFTLTLHGPTKLFVGRVEVARAILQVIEQHAFIQESPIISKPQ